jgi:predicted transcriptional regulator
VSGGSFEIHTTAVFAIPDFYLTLVEPVTARNIAHKISIGGITMIDEPKDSIKFFRRLFRVSAYNIGMTMKVVKGKTNDAKIIRM